MGFWEPLFFWIFALGALVTSLAVIVVRNPLYCALWLVVDFFCFAGLYVLLSAHFLAVVQILVYGGAIMVLFLFIIMLLNLRDADIGERRFQFHQVAAVVSALVLFTFVAGAILSLVDTEEVRENRADYAAQIENAEEPVALRTLSAIPGPGYVADFHAPPLYADLNEVAVEESYHQMLRSWHIGETTPATWKYPAFDPERPFEMPPSLHPDQGIETVVPGREGLYGTFKPISLLLVNRFVIPFELTAILLLAAIIGAVIIAKRRVA